MNLSKKVYYTFAGAMPASFLQKRLEPVCLLPYHHLVSDVSVPHVDELYSYKSVKQFVHDLEVLLRRLKPIGPGELLNSVNSEKSLAQNSFLLSFDDGFREVYDIIAPILIQKGVPAVFFINPAFLDNRQLFYRCKISLLIGRLKTYAISQATVDHWSSLFPGYTSGRQLQAALLAATQNEEPILDELGTELGLDFEDYLKDRQPFMKRSQVEKLATQGFAIGGHSWDHPYYKQLSVAGQVEQSRRSVQYVKTEFRQPWSLFSFPHSDSEVRNSFFKAMDQEEPNIDLYFGTQNQKIERSNRVVHRFNAERPEILMEKQLNGILLYMLLQKWRGRETVGREN